MKFQVREEDLFDEELFSTEQEVEAEPLGGADDAQSTPETSKKRKERRRVKNQHYQQLGPFQDHHIFPKEYASKKLSHLLIL